ncbi:MAG: DUF255 domain-containing protein [Calditrichaeota bacterium]|nr:MAG: DUF255 domain-containing protein [Calditrichota bacterium]
MNRLHSTDEDKMKSTIMNIMKVIAVIMLLFSGDIVANENKSVDWVSFEEAITRAAKENKHIVVDFYTDWCKWCKVMDEQTYKNSEVVTYGNEKFLFAKINAESNTMVSYRGQQFTCRQLTAALGIRGYPATVFMNEKGEFITKISGFIQPDQFMPILEFLDGKYYDKMSFDDFMKTRKS